MANLRDFIIEVNEELASFGVLPVAEDELYHVSESFQISYNAEQAARYIITARDAVNSEDYRG